MGNECLKKKKSHLEEHFALDKFSNLLHSVHFFSGKITKGPFCYSHPRIINLLSLSESKALSSHFPMSVPRKK